MEIEIVDHRSRSVDMVALRLLMIHIGTELMSTQGIAAVTKTATKLKESISCSTLISLGVHLTAVVA